jgi:hypothetical protein
MLIVDPFPKTFLDLTVPLLRTEDKIDEGIEVKVVSDSAVLPNGTSREAEFWEILKPIVYGGLDVSIASLGVISGAAGANAITSMYTLIDFVEFSGMLLRSIT